MFHQQLIGVKPCKLGRPARTSTVVRANLVAKGKPYTPKTIAVHKMMGEGSYGQVFEGYLETPQGPEKVVLKRVKNNVLGAQEMGQMEHLLNVYASRAAKGHCAEFLGYCEVPQEEATMKLTSGVWLLWRYEGSKTLHYYLRRRDCLKSLSRDLGVTEGAVIPTVMKQLLEGLQAFHAAGLVHRDVKPQNIILADEQRRFKLIDLGACADLRYGTNYVPDESILDMNYCPPEQYILPTDSPKISKSLLSRAISPMLWAKHKPDRFDTWSAGIVMLQLAIPPMRTESALKKFNQLYGSKYGYNLEAWRKGTYLTRADCAVLDADEGMGWDLLQSLLSPREIVVDANGGVSFTSDSPFPRPSATESLRHPYIRLAEEPGSYEVPRGSTTTSSEVVDNGGTTSGSGSFGLGQAINMWRNMTNKMFDVEAKLISQASATEKQKANVKQLKQKVAQGQASSDELQKEEGRLVKMQHRLGSLQNELSQTANQANSVLSFLGFRTKPAQPAQEPATSGSTGGKPRSGSRSESPKAGSSGQQAAADPRKAAITKAKPISGSSSESVSKPSAGGLWDYLAEQLREIEYKLSRQATATSRQFSNVDKLKAQVEAGKGDQQALQREEARLNKMQERLVSLQSNLDNIRRQAQKSLLKGQEEEVPAPPAPAPPPAGTGSFWTRLWQNRQQLASPPSKPPSDVPAESKSAGKAEPADALSGPSSWLYQGLKVTSMAVRAAGTMAAKLDEAQRQAAEAQKAAAKQREEAAAAKAAAAAAAATTASAASAAAAAATTAAASPQPPEVDVAAKLEMKMRLVAEANLKALYRRIGVRANSEYNLMTLDIANDPVFLAVPEDACRRRLFGEVVAEAKIESQLMKASEAQKAAEIEQQEQAFYSMLENLPFISSDTTYSEIQKWLSQEARWQVVPERRRRELYSLYLRRKRTGSMDSSYNQPGTAAAAAAAQVPNILAAVAPAAAELVTIPKGANVAANLTETPAPPTTSSANVSIEPMPLSGQAPVEAADAPLLSPSNSEAAPNHQNTAAVTAWQPESSAVSSAAELQVAPHSETQPYDPQNDAGKASADVVQHVSAAVNVAAAAQPQESGTDLSPSSAALQAAPAATLSQPADSSSEQQELTKPAESMQVLIDSAKTEVPIKAASVDIVNSSSSQVISVTPASGDAPVVNSLPPTWPQQPEDVSVLAPLPAVLLEEDRAALIKAAAVAAEAAEVAKPLLDSGASSSIDLSVIEQLKREQERMRLEYEAMARQLREMETRLKQREAALKRMGPLPPAKDGMQPEIINPASSITTTVPADKDLAVSGSPSSNGNGRHSG